MHKMLRIIYGLLKNQAPYDPNIDLKNTAAAKEKKDEVEAKAKELKLEKRLKSERYNEKDVDAPIFKNISKNKKKTGSVPIFRF